MGYVWLSVSLFLGALKGYCGKKLGNFAADTQSAVFLNLIRMLLCILFCVATVLFSGGLTAVTAQPAVLLISALSGVSTSFFLVTWLLSVRKSAYMMLDVFLMMGSLVPMILGRFLFSEPVSLRQWLGFALLVVAALIMCSYNNSVKTKLSLSALLLLIVCGLANGVADFSQKLFVKTFPSQPISIFNLYTYLFAAVTLAVIFAVMSRKKKVHFEKEASKASFLYIIIMAAALTAHSYFKTLSAVTLDSARLYPLSQGAALTLSTLMATFFFKEKFTLKAGLGIFLAFVALMIMNL